MENSPPSFDVLWFVPGFFRLVKIWAKQENREKPDEVLQNCNNVALFVSIM